MSGTIERLDGGDALRRTAQIALAGLLQDVGKVFQRADWQLSQAAERMQEDLCPQVEGRHVHRHILWTYDFCNDHLKWLADYVDLARVIHLAISHHKAAPDDAAALILDAADRLVSGRDDIEIEELQPVIPPQVPLESILWGIAGRIAPAEEAATPENHKRKSRRVRRSRTSSSDAGQAGPEGAEPPPTEAPVPAGEQVPAEVPAPPESGAEAHGPFPEAEAAQAALQHRGYFKAQLLRPDEDVLPSPKRPEMNEEDYRGIGTELVAVCQKIGRMSGRPRIEWLIDALRSALEQRASLVPEYVGSGGQTVSLYSHAAARAAIATALWRWHENTGSLPGPEQKALSLAAVQVEGIDEFLCRPGAGDPGSRVYRGRAALVRLVSRLLGDLLLRQLQLPSVNRLWESDCGLAVLADGSDETLAALQRFAAEQGPRLFEQSGGHLRLVVAEPVRLAPEQLRGGWTEVARAMAANLAAARRRAAADVLQDAAGWREEAAMPDLKDRHGQPQGPQAWAQLAEAYERQLGTSLARGKTIAAYNSPVTPTGSEGEPTVIGPWFVHVGVSAEGLVGWEGLEQVYSIGEADEPWAWVPSWQALPHGPTFRRADESQLRADPLPPRQRQGGPARRRETPMDFEELGWLARRSRKGRGFVGRSWLGCLKIEADGIAQDACELACRCRSLGEAVETARQGQWFWQEFVEGQLRRADRATWRVFVLRCGLGTATLVGPWNTMMVLAGRTEQWWRRWTGSLSAWPARGSLVFAPRDAAAGDLAWLAGHGLAEAEPAEGAGRICVFDRARPWTAYREALRLANLLDEQMQLPEMIEQEAGLVFCRRLLAHELEARSAGGSRSAAAWRAGLAQDVRKLLLARMPRRGERTAAQEELLQELQNMITAGRRGRLRGSVGVAARVALWQNQGETS